MDALPRLISLVGPTSSGKSRLALELAERFDGEIVSADSRQMYRGLDIGTAKPTPAEQRRVPHHLIDLRDPEQGYTVAEYQRDAFAAIDGIIFRDRLPILVGGTGLYHRAVTENLRIPEVAPNPGLRADLESRDIAELAKRLQKRDPDTAAQTDLANPRRVIRALEVLEISGQGLAAHHAPQPLRYQTMKVGLEVAPDELRTRIRAQVSERFSNGLVAEVRGLLAQGYDPATLTERAIAYGPVIGLLDATLSESAALEQVIQLEAAYAKRQRTWFRKDPEITWLQDPSEAAGFISEWLTTESAQPATKAVA